MEMQNDLLDQEFDQPSRKTGLWNLVYYINLGLFVVTMIGFLGILPGLLLMVPLGFVKLASMTALLVFRLQQNLGVKCVVVYYAVAAVLLSLGSTASNGVLPINNRVKGVILGVGVFASMILAGYVCYTLNKHRKEIRG